MSDSIRIEGPVEIEQPSEASAAFQLMDHIWRMEEGRDADQKTREYWLTLYYQCRKATKGHSTLESILKEK